MSSHRSGSALRAASPLSSSPGGPADTCDGWAFLQLLERTFTQRKKLSEQSRIAADELSKNEAVSRPKVSAGSKKLIEGKPGEKAGFLDRLEKQMERRKEMHSGGLGTDTPTHALDADAKECTFTPMITADAHSRRLAGAPGEQIFNNRSWFKKVRFQSLITGGV